MNCVLIQARVCSYLPHAIHADLINDIARFGGMSELSIRDSAGKLSWSARSAIHGTLTFSNATGIHVLGSGVTYNATDGHLLIPPGAEHLNFTWSSATVWYQQRAAITISTQILDPAKYTLYVLRPDGSLVWDTAISTGTLTLKLCVDDGFIFQFVENHTESTANLSLDIHIENG